MAMGKELKLMIKIGGKIDKTLGSAIANAQSQLETMRKAVGGAMTAEIAAVTAAGTAFVADSVRTYKDYETAITNAAATAGAEKGSEAYKMLDEAAREAGQATVKTAAESANALEYMALAGWSAADSAKALQPMIKLSAATNMELAAASDLVTDSMAAYGLKINELPRYLDVLTSANNTANYNAQQLLESFIGSAGVLRTLNVEVEDGAALLGVLANRSIKASEAGTALNAILLNMQGISPKSQAKDAMEQLGISMFDAAGKTRNMLEVFQEVADATANMTEEERSTIYGMIGGKSHVADFTNLMMGFRDKTAEGVIEVYKLSEAFRNSGGTLDKMYETKTNTLEGGIKALESAYESMKISVGEAAAPYMKELAAGMIEKIPEIEKVVINALDKIFPILGKVFDFIVDNSDTIIDNVIKITALFAGLKIGTGVIKGVNAFISLGKNLYTISKAAGAARTAAGAFSAITGIVPVLETTSAAAANAGTAAASAGTAAANAAASAGTAAANAAGTAASAVGAASAGISAAAESMAGAAGTANTAWSEVLSTIGKITPLAEDAAGAVGILAETGGYTATLGSLGLLFGAFTGTTALFAAGVKGLDHYRKKLGKTGTEALTQASLFDETAKEVFDLTNESKTVEEYIRQFNEFQNLQSLGDYNNPEYETALYEAEQKHKEAEQWFIDNYSAYITAEEQKNGVRQSTLDIIQKIVNAQKEQAKAENEAAMNELWKNNRGRSADAEKAAGGIIDLTSENKAIEEQIRQNQNMLSQLPEIEEKYNIIMNNLSGKDRIESLNALRSEYADVFANFKKLGVGELELANIGADYQNIKNNIESLNSALEQNNGYIEGYKQSISDYKAALDTMQSAVANEALFNTGYSSISELFSSGDTAAINQALFEVKHTCEQLSMTSEETAVSMSLFKNGFTDLTSAIDSGALDAVTQDFIKLYEAMGKGKDEIAVEAALLKNGFLNINEAIASGNLDGLITDLGQIGKELGLSTDGVTNLINSLGLLPSGKYIEFTDNHYKIVEDYELTKSYLSDNITVTVDAQGNLTVIDEVMGKTQFLKELGAVNLYVNSEGNLDVLNNANQKIAEINQTTGIITVTSDTQEAEQNVNKTVAEADSKTADINVGADVSVAAASVDKFISETEAKSATLDVNVKYNIPDTPGFASGTISAPGGLALVNDQNTADPREIIEYGGRRWFYEGRNVLANLPKGARIYNAMQSKALLAETEAIVNGSHKNGLDYVPFDGYIAELHKGEKVLTDEEAKDYDKNGLIAQAVKKLTASRNANIKNEDNSDNSSENHISLTVNVYGNADEGTIKNAGKSLIKEIESYLQKRERDKRRKSFA